MSLTHNSQQQQQQVRNRDQDDSSVSSLYISPPVSSPHVKESTTNSRSSSSSSDNSNHQTLNTSSIEKDAQFHQQYQEQQNSVRRKRRSDATDRYVVDFGEIDARLVDTLNQPSENANASTADAHGNCGSESSVKKRRKSATPANQHFITDFFKPPAVASVSISDSINQEETTNEVVEAQSDHNQQQHTYSSQDLEQRQDSDIDGTISPPPPQTPHKRKRTRGAPVTAAFKTPERLRAVLEVPSSTPGLSPITKASLSVAAMVAAGVRDLSFVSPTPRTRCSGAPPVVPPFRITRGSTKVSDNSGEVVRIGSVVAASVWEDYEEIVVGDCELGSETDEDYLSDSHTNAHAKRKRQQLQRDLSVSSASSQIHPIQGRAREPQYEKELQISGSSSSGVFGEEEAEGDTEPEDSQELEPELENADMEMLGAKLASESICSTVSSIRSPLRMVSHDQKYSDGDDDASSALLSSLEFPCAQRASESVYSRGGSSSDDDRNLDESKLACRGQKTKGGRCDGDEAHADTEAGAEADDDDVINSSADDEVLRVWDEQRQRAPPAFLLLESRYDPVDDRSLAADSEAAAAAAVMAAVAAEDDLFSPRLRHRSSQSLSQSLGPIDSTATVVTVGGSRRTGERYPYSTQRPIDHDTEAEDNDMSDINDVNDESGHADLAHLSGSTQQQQQQQQQQRQSRRRQQVTVPLTQYLQLTQAQPPLSFTQNQPQQRQQQQVSTSEALPSTQYYVDHILTTSMLESLPLPELLPSSSSPAHLYRHAPHSRARREQQ